MNEELSKRNEMTNNTTTSITVTTSNKNIIPKYSGRNSTIADEWIQATEARYDSMENLLQSVRHDIDVLTERLNIQTTPTSPELIRSTTATTTEIDNKQINVEGKPSSSTTKSLIPSPHSTQSFMISHYEKDLSDNLKCMNDKDEFMDIRIRSIKRQFVNSSEDQLSNCSGVYQFNDIHKDKSQHDNMNTISHDNNDYNDKSGSEEGKYLTKTWRSPSDFNLHDPFSDQLDNFSHETYDITNNQHRTIRYIKIKQIGSSDTASNDIANEDENEDDDEVIEYNFPSHDHQSIIETDLDDYQPDKQEHSATESENSSLSPAISPTFGNYISDEIKLKNIIISNNDTITFSINNKYLDDNNIYSNDISIKKLNSEDFQVYDNGYSLTTIDEASEENDDDECSSNEGVSSPNKHIITEQPLTEDIKILKSPFAHYEDDKVSINQSISKETKIPPIDNNNNKIVDHQQHITKQDENVDNFNPKHQQQSERINYFADNININNNSFIFHEKDISISECGLQSSNIVLLRPKYIDSSSGISSHHKSRPVSADLLRNNNNHNPNYNKKLEKSHSSSLSSMLSTKSQESIISEADSYVTVCSRLIGTGSEEAYITAQSDSDAFNEQTLYTDSHTDDEENDCQTISRKKTKTLSHRSLKRKCAADTGLDSESASELENDDEHVLDSVVTTPTAVTVTPKFIKLPSKLTASCENSIELKHIDIYSFHANKSYIVDTNHKNSNDMRKYEELSIDVKDESKELEENADKREVLSTPYKRVTLKRPNRLNSNITDLLSDKMNCSDSDNDDSSASAFTSSSSSSSSSSDELHEAHYDISQPESWIDTNTKQLSSMIYRPNYHMTTNEPQKKRLSKIIEISQSSLNDDDNDDNSNDDENCQLAHSSSLSLQKDESLLTSSNISNTNMPTLLNNNVSYSDTLKSKVINKNTRALTQTNHLLVNNYEPVTPVVQSTDDDNDKNIFIVNQNNQQFLNSQNRKENTNLHLILNNNHLQQYEINSNQDEKQISLDKHVNNNDRKGNLYENIEKFNKSQETTKISNEKELNSSEFIENQSEIMYHNYTNKRLPQTSSSSSTYVKKEHFYPKDYRQALNETKLPQRYNEHIQFIESSNSSQFYASNLYENNLIESSYTDDIVQKSYPTEHRDCVITSKQLRDNQPPSSTNRIVEASDEMKIRKPYEIHSENFYDNEFDQYNRITKTSNNFSGHSAIAVTSPSLLHKSPFVIGDRPRFTDHCNNVPLLQENETSTNAVSFDVIKQPASQYHQMNTKQDDIQLASQRKSRILQGDGGNLDNRVINSTTYIPGPISTETVFVDNQTTDKLCVTKNCRQNMPGLRELTGSSNYEPVHNYQSYKSVTIKDETHNPSVKSNELPSDFNDNDRPLPSPSNYNTCLDFKTKEQPKMSGYKEPVQLSRTMISEADVTHKHRHVSPSPPRYRHILPPSLVTSKPPTHYLSRTKWHLKPIPTDEEIRERLRSSSRKRYEERQSRSIQNSQPSTYRPRSSRSDSRYRFTDLDSAIAESRADTNETTYQLNTESEPHSEARQSASLFDLDAQIQKSKTPTTSTYQHSTDQHGIQNMTGKLLTKKLFNDTKSYSSLLETDIDTGENFKRPVILETDLDKLDTQINDGTFDAAIVDTYQDRTRSLYNLTLTHTPGVFRRQKSNEFGGNTTQTNEIELIQSPNDQWYKAKSYQGLANNKESDLQKIPPQYEVGRYKKKTTSGGAQGLIDRLKEKARSTHELRIAQSLTKLHIPEWLDKANCLQTPSDLMSTNTIKADQKHDSTIQAEQSVQRDFSNTIYTPRTNKALISSLRSLSRICKPSDNPLTNSLNLSQKTIETIAEPIWPKSENCNSPNFVRPSQLIKQKSGQFNNYLRPIQSKLNNSMRSFSAQRCKSTELQDIQPQVAPRYNYTKGQGKLIELNPQDFIPKYEQRWGKEKLNRFDRAITEPPDRCSVNILPTAYLDNNSKLSLNQSDSTAKVNLISSPNVMTQNYDAYSKHPITSLSDIKDVDHDSGTENSNEHQNVSSEDDRKQFNVQYGNVNTTTNVLITSKKYPNQNHESIHFIQKNANSSENCLSLDDSKSKESSEVVNVPDKISYNDVCSADADGETESEVTDGFDQLSDLTCLTSLLDTCSSRHRSLLANRPSALEHLLVSVGWWPVYPEAEHRYLPPTAAEAISIAAHEFDVKEDSHRYEYLQFISGPNSYKPLNLGEFGLNQLSGAITRHPIDGLLYISCGRPTCSTKPVPVSQANNWCACANCFTLYCSNKCREECEKNPSDHPSVCPFSRAKRVCCRLLRNLAPGQITGLTALAKTGMARLGRGGILLPFSLIKHAETFLKRSLEHSFVNEELKDSSVEKALHQWEKLHQPSPGGLMAPPTYLTLNELEELDSSIANPCRSYNPSSSMVLIVVVCAYDLIARTDGRPVHLFKQSLILPFPSHSNLRSKHEVTTSQNTRPIEKGTVPSHINGTGTTMKTDKQARETYMLHLQRMLRERGVSLRHHYPEIYTRIANFVETGIPFSQIRISFDDFLLQKQVNCIIQPMKDLYIEPISNSNQNFNESEKNNSSTNIQSKYAKTTKPHDINLVNRKKLTETNF